MNRKCPADCGNSIPGSDILCPSCMHHVSHPTRSALGSGWRRLQKTGRLGDMQSYQDIVNRAIREARLWNRASSDTLAADG